MSAPINYLNDSEEEELGALIYKSSQTAKKFLGLGSSTSASASGGALSNTKKRAGPRPPADDFSASARNEGCKLIHESSFRYSLRSASKKFKVEVATDESNCTGDNMFQQNQSQASTDNVVDSIDDEYLAKKSSSITSHSTGKRYNLRRASNRQASNEATEPEPERISSAASTTPPSLSLSMYCAVINEDGKSAEEMEGTYTDSKGRKFVIQRRGGKKYKQYCKPEDVNKKVSRAILLCKQPGCASACRKGGVCVKHGGKSLRCKVEGCTKQSQTKQLCYRHGAPRKICKHNGCTNRARGAGGVCTRHGHKQRAIICKHEGCQSQARKDGLCFEHSPGGYSKCKVEGCHKKARAGGACRGHAQSRHASNEATEPEPERISSAASTTPPSLSSTYCAIINEDGKSAAKMEGTHTDRKGREFVIERRGGKKYKQYCKPEDVNKKVSRVRILCKHPGCINESSRGDVCVKHGAKKKCCKVEGCTNQSQVNNLCYRHGAPRKICKHKGCTNIAEGAGGICTRHGSYKRRTTICKHEGCQSQARKGCLCLKHLPGGYPKCKVEGCHKNARRTGGTCRGHAPSTLKPNLCKNKGKNAVKLKGAPVKAKQITSVIDMEKRKYANTMAVQT